MGHKSNRLHISWFKKVYGVKSIHMIYLKGWFQNHSWVPIGLISIHKTIVLKTIEEPQRELFPKWISDNIMASSWVEPGMKSKHGVIQTVHMVSFKQFYRILKGVAWRYGARTSPKEVPRSSHRTAALFPIPLPPTFPRPKPAWSNNT